MLGFKYFETLKYYVAGTKQKITFLNTNNKITAKLKK